MNQWALLLVVQRLTNFEKILNPELSSGFSLINDLSSK